MDEILPVSESYIRKATAMMIGQEKLVVETSSAITAAAVMEYPERINGKNVALIMTGGNIDADRIAQLLEENR